MKKGEFDEKIETSLSNLIGLPVFPFPFSIHFAGALVLECEGESDAPRSISEQMLRNSAD
jgi:hypothetical protein